MLLAERKENSVDVTDYDCSAFVGDYGIAVKNDGFASSGRHRFIIELYVGGDMVHGDVMTTWDTRPWTVLGSAIAFMTDYEVCEDSGILDGWYDDPRREHLEMIGYDLENSDEPVWELHNRSYHIKLD